MKFKLLAFAITVLVSFSALSQEQEIRQKTFEDFDSNLWIGSYNQFRLSEKLFWRAEFHYRRANTDEQDFVGRLAQIYNRHALTYLFTKNFNMSVGGVLRLNFTPEEGNEDFNYVVPEPRIWHEYLFMMPFTRFQLYHRIRIEHRWSKSNLIDADWVYRDRWRYKTYMKIPLNNTSLVPGTVYFNPDVEIILQTGKNVIDSPVEDLRIYPSFAYISSPRVTYSAGLMYTTGQNINDGSIYSQRWVVRLNAYISLDLRKREKQIPSIRALD